MPSKLSAALAATALVLGAGGQALSAPAIAKVPRHLGGHGPIATTHHPRLGGGGSAQNQRTGAGRGQGGQGAGSKPCQTYGGGDTPGPDTGYATKGGHRKPGHHPKNVVCGQNGSRA